MLYPDFDYSGDSVPEKLVWVLSWLMYFLAIVMVGIDTVMPSEYFLLMFYHTTSLFITPFLFPK